MRIILGIFLVMVIFSPVFAYSDIGLLQNQRTISYFVMPTTDFSNVSSGLVYNQRQNDRMALEVSYTSYKSVYLFTRNITKLRIDQKYKIASLGPFSLTGLAGPAVYYAPNVGGGLALDAGGILSANILSNFATSFLLNGIFFRDGAEINLGPTVNFAYNQNLEMYGGFRVEGGMIFENLQGGKFNFYTNVGARIGL